MELATSLPLAALKNLGSVKAGGLQVHTIRQVATIHGPNLIGPDGDLTLDTGDIARSGNGHVRIRGGVQGSTKHDVFEAGVWDRDLDIGPLAGGDGAIATTFAQHLSVGTLLTGLRIPTVTGMPMDPNKVYALRSIGTQGHVAWDNISDVSGGLNVAGVLSTSGASVVTRDLSVGGSGTMRGPVALGGTLSVAGSVTIEKALSVGARFDLNSQLRVGGITVLSSSLSVASTGVFGDTLSVANGLTADRLDIARWLSVGLGITTALDLSVGRNVALNDLYVRGKIAPLSNGLSVAGAIVSADGLSVASALTASDRLSVGGAVDLSGNTFACRAGSVLIGAADNTSTIALRGSRVDLVAPLRLGGSLSVGSVSSVVLDTPLLSLGGHVTISGDATVQGESRMALNVSCGQTGWFGGSIGVARDATVGRTLNIGTDLSVGGTVTILGDLDVQGTTTTISSTTLTVEDKTLELGVVEAPTDTSAVGAGIVIKGTTDKSITYVRSDTASTSHKQLSGFALSEDLVIAKKQKAFNEETNSLLQDNERSHVIHIGDLTSTDGHWMIVSDITNQKLQFWYGHDIADDEPLDGMPASSARLAFEIQKPI